MFYLLSILHVMSALQNTEYCMILCKMHEQICDFSDDGMRIGLEMYLESKLAACLTYLSI